MTVYDWLWFLLTCWGVTAIVVDSHLLAGIRRDTRDWWVIGRLLRCYQCSGWWVGFIGATWLKQLGLRAVAAAFVSSGVCYIGGAFVRGMLGPTTDG